MRIASTLTLLFSLSLLSACAPQHSVLGANAGWYVWEWDVQVLLDAQVDRLRVRHVRMRNPSCASGYEEHLELSGPIGPDSTAAIESLLPKLDKCIDADGVWRVNNVYLSSSGGLLKDGYELGRLFRQYQVNTAIIGKQRCSSSCAIAFLGGKYRYMSHDAQLLFHAPYTTDGLAIDCSDRGQLAELKSYYQEFLGFKEGGYLFDRTMTYCSVSDGWTLNADGARLLGITNR